MGFTSGYSLIISRTYFVVKRPSELEFWTSIEIEVSLSMNLTIGTLELIKLTSDTQEHHSSLFQSYLKTSIDPMGSNFK